MAKHKRILAAIALLILAALPLGVAKVASAQAVVQSYGSDSSLTPGMIVQLDTKDPSKVAPATQGTIDRIHGVVVSPNDAPVSLQNSTTTQQYYIATDGTYQALVSDQNGPIYKGDYVTVSSLAGVGMKASNSQTVVLGKALNNFDGSANVQGTSTLTATGGQKTTVHLGQIGIDISIAHNPLYQPSVKNAAEDALQKFGESVAHKPVSLTHVYISIGVLLASIGVSSVMLITGVRTSLAAVGRNPLARSHILRGLIQITFTSLIIFLIGVFAVYLLLKV
ncbi:MAG TPA: hypothetical protein VGG13_02160 [Candidatus Saccharimonadales bacterium]|jgi:hypothetical protein